MIIEFKYQIRFFLYSLFFFFCFHLNMSDLVTRIIQKHVLLLPLVFIPHLEPWLLQLFLAAVLYLCPPLFLILEYTFIQSVHLCPGHPLDLLPFIVSVITSFNIPLGLQPCVPLIPNVRKSE